MSSSFAGFTLGERMAVNAFGETFEGSGPGGRRARVLWVDPRLSRREAFAAAFLRTGELLTGLVHPSLVATIAVGRAAGGGLAVVTEDLSGPVTLDACLRDAALSGQLPTPGVALYVARCVAAALARAHRAGIVHGGVHPRSVTIDIDGDVRLGDFVAARALAAAAAEDPTLFAGLRGYVAPELALGDPPGAASDVYAAGALLHELLSGAPPPGTVKAPHPLLAVLERALATDARERYADGAELLLALERAAAELGADRVDRRDVARFVDEIRGAAEASLDAETEDVLSSLAAPANEDGPTRTEHTPLPPPVPFHQVTTAELTALPLLPELLGDELTSGDGSLQEDKGAIPEAGLARDFSESLPTIEDGPRRARLPLMADELSPAPTVSTVARSASPVAIDGIVSALAPTPAPTVARPAAPTAATTAVPTAARTAARTAAPTAARTAARTAAPTAAPMAAPMAVPTPAPTVARPAAPTAATTVVPTAASTVAPTSPSAASDPPPARPVGPIGDLDPAVVAPPVKAGLGKLWLGLALLSLAALAIVLEIETDVFHPARRRARQAEEAARREAETKAREAARPRTGDIVIDSEPADAAVWMLLGRSPVESPLLDAATSHQLRVEHEGFIPYDITVAPPDFVPRPGSEERLARVSARLKPAPTGYVAPAAPPEPPPVPSAAPARGRIRVEAEPAGAEVYLLVGFTPAVRVTRLPIDRGHEFKVVRDGFTPARIQVPPEKWREGGGPPRLEVDARATLVPRPTETTRIGPALKPRGSP